MNCNLYHYILNVYDISKFHMIVSDCAKLHTCCASLAILHNRKYRWNIDVKFALNLFLLVSVC